MRPPLTPTLEEFTRLATDYNVVSVWCELVADVETPIAAYRKLGGDAPSFLLESAEHSDHVGRYSFLGAGARWTLSAHGRRVTFRGPGGERIFEAEEDPLRELEKLMAAYRVAPQEGAPLFRGGAVGYLAYDAVRWFEPVIGPPPKDELGAPDLFFMLTDVVVAFDHRRRRMKVLANALLDGTDPRSAYEDAARRVEAIIGRLGAPAEFAPIPTEVSAPVEAMACNTTREQFHAMVETAKEYIRAGDIFQMVPSQRFETPFGGDPVDLYRALRFVNPSPYMFCLRVNDSFALVGSSPEVHVRVTDGLVEIRPIAGTRRRGETAAEDAELERDLLADPKERAEHLMLVDLARNDVGRIAEFASVEVSEFMTVERYSHVMHIVTHVSGRLKADRSAFDVMRATFPAGTVSGSPKVRAMQIINDLERSKRCIYAGAVGYFGFDGNLDSCIALRTIVLKNGTAYVQAGGGVVADSIPEAEYQESVNKAMAASRAIAMARNFGF
ncbi:MAG: anthranilate synthase component I [Terrimicrobiaceae bacterium]|nr:anthranilate synthase component I [Terrimicrobiaceae bacterium]